MHKIRKYLVLITVFVFQLSNSCKEENEVFITDANFNPSVTYGSMTDQDGNTYKTVTIGTQVWMAENLKTTKYRNGDPIPNVTENLQWKNLTTGAFCNYNNDNKVGTNYGRLYNSYAVYDNRNIAPTGWHVASNSDWENLENYIGGQFTGGVRLKEIGTKHWISPNQDATNETGFTAIPGGLRESGVCYGIGEIAIWWSSTTSSTLGWGIGWSLSYVDNGLGLGSLFEGNIGTSIRCVKDN
jgi:uncharacterized protein (TIGR02145 family)